MDVERTTSSSIERREVAERLGEFEYRERVGLARDRYVLNRSGGHEHEYTGIRPAFVQLSGRVQIPRSVAEGRCRVRLVANGKAEGRECIEDCLIRPDVGEKRDVV